MLKIFLLVLLAIFCTLLLYNIILYIRSRKWISTEAIIHTVFFGLKKVSIKFSYLALFQSYEHYKTFTFYSDVEAKSFAMKKGLKEKGTLEIFYNPKKPYYIILSKGFNRFNTYAVKICAYALIVHICLLCLYLYKLKTQ